MPKKHQWPLVCCELRGRDTNNKSRTCHQCNACGVYSKKAMSESSDKILAEADAYSFDRYIDEVIDDSLQEACGGRQHPFYEDTH